jgi:hypothetical protein
MENRERDRMSQRTSSTDAGDLNRSVEEKKGREHNSGTSAEFGQGIGRSENLEGGNMRNRNDEPMTNIGSSTGSGREVREDDTSRRGTGSSSSGDFSSSGSSKQKGSESWRDEESSSTGSSNTGSSSNDSNRSRNDSGEGRH